MDTLIPAHIPMHLHTLTDLEVPASVAHSVQPDPSVSEAELCLLPCGGEKQQGL